MKSKILLTAILISGFLCTYAQDNKPTTGDIGVHYNVAFNGQVQQQIGISDVLSKHLELGGNLLFTYTGTHNETNSATYLEAVSGTIPGITSVGTKSKSYSLGLNPYLLYHFAIKSNLDLYAGGSFTVGFGNSSSTTFTTNSGANYLSTTNEQISPPATVTLSLGAVLGCQYFFYKNLALGVNCGLGAGYSIQKGNKTDYITSTESGSNNPSSGTNTSGPPFPSVKNETFNLSTMASAGISLAFYFSRHKGKE